MQEEKKVALGIRKNDHELSSQEKKRRKDRLLTQGTPSITHSIADALVVKNENIYFLTKPDGNIPLDGNHGFGLYYHDCRYLNGYDLKIAGTDPNVLVSDADMGFAAVLELANPEIQVGKGEHISMDEIGIKWERVIDAGKNTLYELITFQNYGRQSVHLPLTLEFQSDFEDVFAIRGLLPEQPGKLDPPKWDEGILTFRYQGADNLYRSLAIHFSPKPDEAEERTAIFHVDLQSRESKDFMVSMVIVETEDEEELNPKAQDQPDLKGIQTYFQRESDQWLADQTKVHSDSLLLNQLMERSLRDLRTLRNNLKQEEYFAAGVPWFTTLFGRDSLIASLQTLAYNPEIAAETLRLLAKYQGKEENHWRDEQPGKILHELRVGELARLGEIPHTPYYGSVDATPLFLILVAKHAAWTGSLDLFDELKDPIEKALNWIDQYGDSNGDGYVEYQSMSEHGLVNQGWKDSGDAIVNGEGKLADPPISLVEVQGYAYMAKNELAGLYEKSGEVDRAKQLRAEAAELRERFNRDFWLDDLGFYTLALEKGGKPVTVISSNPGHTLWAGIADEGKARQTVNRLMAEDMFSGWGIRTLSSESQSYNPTGYHLGTVWPHDNSMIAAGFKNYGFEEKASQIFTGIAEAAMRFVAYRLPELFSGFPRADYKVPVQYPVACHPQAWAAGSIPYMVTTLLGLTPEAFEKRLRIIQPTLPEFIDRLQVRRLRVGNANVDLDFERTTSGTIAVHVVNVEGDLDILVSARSSS